MTPTDFAIAVDRIGKVMLSKQGLTWSPGWEQTHQPVYDRAVELVLSLDALGIIKVTNVPSFRPDI